MFIQRYCSVQIGHAMTIIGQAGYRWLETMAPSRDNKTIIGQDVNFSIAAGNMNCPVCAVDFLHQTRAKVDICRLEQFGQWRNHRFGISLIKTWPDDQRG